MLSVGSYLEKQMLLDTLSLHQNYSVPRNAVQIFMEMLIKHHKTTFFEYMMQHLQVQLTCECKSQTLKIVKNVFKDSLVIMEAFDSEYKRFEIYKQKNLMMMPVQYELK